MLESFRKLSQNFFFRLFLGILLVAFIFSGLGGISRMKFNTDYVVKVGDRNITKENIDQKYDETVRNIRRSGLDFNEQQLTAMGVSKVQILRDLVQQSLVRQEVESLDLKIGDEAVLDQIKNIPQFQTNGKFDREKFNITLGGLGLSEQQFIKVLRDELENNLLMGTIVKNVPVNDYVSDNAMKYYSETRDVEVVKIPKDVAEYPHEPGEKDLKDFYFENSYQFQVPETRDISYITIPRNKANESVVYEQTVKIEDELAAGSSLKEIADKFKLKLESNNGLTRDNKDFPELFVQTAFGKDQGKTSDLVYDEKASEYYVIGVEKVSAAHIPDLPDVKTEVVEAWKEKKANDLNAKRIDEMVDELKKSNSDLRSFAGAHGYKYEVVKGIKRSDDDKQGARFVNEVFASKEGEVVGSYQNNDGSFRIARLKSVGHAELTDEESEKYQDQFSDTVKIEIMDQYFDYLRHKFTVKQNAKYAEEQGNQLQLPAVKKPKLVKLK